MIWLTWRQFRAQTAVAVTALEVASTRPDGLSARTWKKAALGAAITVSKPALDVVETG